MFGFMPGRSAFQTVDYPGVVDTIMKYIALPKDYAETEECITGEFPDTHIVELL